MEGHIWHDLNYAPNVKRAWKCTQCGHVFVWHQKPDPAERFPLDYQKDSPTYACEDLVMLAVMDS